MRLLKVWGSSEVPISQFPIPGLQGLLSLQCLGVGSWGALSRASFGGRSKEVSASPSHGAEDAPEEKGSTESFPILFDMNFKPFYMDF